MMLDVALRQSAAMGFARHAAVPETAALCAPKQDIEASNYRTEGSGLGSEEFVQGTRSTPSEVPRPPPPWKRFQCTAAPVLSPEGCQPIETRQYRHLHDRARAIRLASGHRWPVAETDDEAECIIDNLRRKLGKRAAPEELWFELGTRLNSKLPQIVAMGRQDTRGSGHGRRLANQIGCRLFPELAAQERPDWRDPVSRTLPRFGSGRLSQEHPNDRNFWQHCAWWQMTTTSGSTSRQSSSSWSPSLRVPSHTNASSLELGSFIRRFPQDGWRPSVPAPLRECRSFRQSSPSSSSTAAGSDSQHSQQLLWPPAEEEEEASNEMAGWASNGNKDVKGETAGQEVKEPGQWQRQQWQSHDQAAGRRMKARRHNGRVTGKGRVRTPAARVLDAT